jgi:vitamin-K-epoxide reductase (warfarin-sensitive)
MINSLYVTDFVGILLSGYALYIEYKLKRNSGYKAACDISNRVSCTRTFHSSYGKTFYVSNGLWGVIYYLIVAGLIFYGRPDFILIASACGVLFSARLAYILYFKLKNFCLICNGIYAVNILLLVLAWMNH